MLRILIHFFFLLAVVACGAPTDSGISTDNRSGSGGRSLDAIIRDGILRVGVNPNFPPMSSYGSTNELEGFDIDISRKIADALGVEAQFVVTETAQRVPFLLSNRIDIALGALTRTPERAKLIGFTVPLHTESMGVITTDRIDVATWSDLDREDITLVNMRGNLSVELLKSRLPKPQVMLVDSNADTIRAIAQGRADALVENVDFFLNFTRNYANVNWQVLKDPIYVAWCGIGLIKSNRELQDFLNVLLYDLHSNGSIGQTWEKWYGAPMSVPVTPDPFF